MKKNYFKTLWKAIFNKIPPQEPQYMISVSNGSIWSSVSINGNMSENEGENQGFKQEKKQQKISVKPVEVFHELERVPTVWSLEGLDDKIAITKEKINLTKQTQVKSELEFFLFCLENRKKYHKKDSTKQPFSAYYKSFDTTTDEKVTELTDKYDLVLGEPDLFIPELPPEAILIMKEFTEKTIELCDKKPNFKIIAEAKDFREQTKKRDPILLVRSPFGMYYYILGAWDKEMQLLSEL